MQIWRDSAIAASPSAGVVSSSAARFEFCFCAPLLHFCTEHEHDADFETLLMDYNYMQYSYTHDTHDDTLLHGVSRGLLHPPTVADDVVFRRKGLLISFRDAARSYINQEVPPPPAAPTGG